MAVTLLPRAEPPAHTAGELADRLGEVKARIADLELEERALRAELIALGLPRVEGSLFRATVSSSVRWQPDKALLVAALGGEDASTRCCRPTSVTTVRVGARS